MARLVGVVVHYRVVIEEVLASLGNGDIVIVSLRYRHIDE